MRRSLQLKIYERLNARFKLEPGAPFSPLWLNELIQLVSDVDALLREPVIGSHTDDISAASGWTTYFTVPAKKKWSLWLVVKPVTTGNSRPCIFDGTNRVVLIATGATSGSVLPVNKIPLKAGWRIQMANTNNGADTSIGAQILYEEEDAY